MFESPRRVSAIRSNPVVVRATTFPDSDRRGLLMMESIYDVRSGDMRNLKGEGEQQWRMLALGYS